MFEYIGFFFLVFTCLVGIFELVSIITEFLFEKADTPEKVISILPLSGHNEKIEYLVRGVLLKTKAQVIVIDRGLDKEDLEIIQNLQSEYSKLKIVCV